MRTIIVAISLCTGLWIDASYAAAQKSQACLDAMSNEHGILTQLAQFATKSDQEKMADRDQYCKLQTSRRASLQVLKAMGNGCDLYKAERLDSYISSNQKVLDKKCN